MGRWNPFAMQGRRAEFGWLDLILDRDDNVTLTVEHYLDHDTILTQSFNVTAQVDDIETEGLEDEKVIKRIPINAVGRFHRIKITNSGADNRPRIHAIIPYFAPGGDLI